MSEWFKEHAWKACVGETLPRVRIPLSPPSFAKRSLRSRLRLAGRVKRAQRHPSLTSSNLRLPRHASLFVRWLADVDPQVRNNSLRVRSERSNDMRRPICLAL